MNNYRNREAVKTITVMAATAIIAVFFVGMISYGVLKQEKAEENDAVLSLLAQVKTQNPNAELLSYIKLLNAKKPEGETVSDADFGAERAVITQEIRQELAQYGITETDYLMKTGQAAAEKILCTVTLMSLLGAGLVILLFLRYVSYRRKKLEALSRYLEQIAAGNYDLELFDNSEDELSLLKNQLYKLTVTLREQEKNAGEQKRALAESVEDISHQLKTPLTSVSILLDNLAENEEINPQTRKRFLNEIIRQVQGMNWLIISMLKLSKLDAGVVKLEEKEFSLAPVIREALKNLEVLAELKGVEISCELLKQREKEITLYGDEAWNREAIQNVLKNAIEHSKENTPVTIRVEDNSVYTAVTITNEGKPISKEMQKQIFSRHYSAADAGENNMGIGLPLAKAILEKQNGYLTVESTQEKTSFILKYLKQRNQMSS